MSDEIKISIKLVSIISVIVIIILLIGAYFIFFYGKHTKNEVERYKSAVYDSLVCQFSCPIQTVHIDNRTQALPETNCIKTCSSALTKENFKNDTYTKEELLNDNLFVDIDQLIVQCKSASTNSTRDLDYKAYFDCNYQKLQELKQKYPYLK